MLEPLKADKCTQADATTPENDWSAISKRKPSQSSGTSRPQKRAKMGSGTHTLEIIEVTGDLFDAPPNAVLVHACNCEGQWGAGIAKAFRTKHPDAYKEYQGHCKISGTQALGTALLISPSAETLDGHYIGCLFTSAFKGKKKGSQTEIMHATRTAMADLLRQVRDHADISEVQMCRINSGLFAVPWRKTKEVLQGIEVEGGGAVKVMVVSPST